MPPQNPNYGKSAVKMDKQKLLDRLRSLKILADPTRGGSTGERDAALTAIKRIKERHNIADHEVPSEDTRGAFRASGFGFRPPPRYGQYSRAHYGRSYSQYSRRYSSRPRATRRTAFVGSDHTDTEYVYFVNTSVRIKGPGLLFRQIAEALGFRTLQITPPNELKRIQWTIRREKVRTEQDRLRKEPNIHEVISIYSHIYRDLAYRLKQQLKLDNPKNASAYRRAFWEQAAFTIGDRIRERPAPAYRRNKATNPQGMDAGKALAEKTVIPAHHNPPPNKRP